MANSGIDTSDLLTPGQVIKCAALDPQARPGLREHFAEPTRLAVEALMGGSGIVMDDPPQQASQFTLSEIRILARTAAATYVFAGNEAYKLLNKASPFKFASDLDLPLDGVTDATAALDAGFQAGGSYLIDVPAGLVVSYPLRLASGTSVGFSAATELLAGNAACVQAHGYFAENYGAAPLRLAADAAQGDTTFGIVTDPAGGGAVSAFLPTTGRLVLRAGANLYESRITALDDDARTVTCADPIGFAASAADATLTSQVLLHLDADVTGSVIPVRSGEIGLVSLYQYVLVIDDSSAAAGVPSSVESAKVVGIQTDGPNTITLDRPLRRTFLAASNARVQVLAPVVGATVSGARVRFTEPPTAARVDTFAINYGVDCLMEGCRVLNEDAFGSRGQMFRTYRSYRCGFRDVWGTHPKFRDAGEGHGFSAVQSTLCFCEEARFDACRDSVRFEASTDCWAEEISSTNPLLAHVRCIGAGESGCVARFVDAEGGTSLFAAGGTTMSAGSYDCLVTEVASHNPSGAHVQLAAPASRCGVTRFEFYGGTSAFAGTDHGTNAALIGDDNYLREGRVYGPIGDYAIKVDGGVNTTTGRGMRRPTVVNVEFIGCDKHFYMRRCTKPHLRDCDIVAPAAQTTAWAVLGQDATGLEVEGCTFRAVANIFNLTNCPNSRGHRNTYVDLTGGSEYLDGGGNTGTVGAGNVWLGFSSLSTLLPQ